MGNGLAGASRLPPHPPWLAALAYAHRATALFGDQQGPRTAGVRWHTVTRGPRLSTWLKRAEILPGAPLIHLWMFRFRLALKVLLRESEPIPNRDRKADQLAQRARASS